MKAKLIKTTNLLMNDQYAGLIGNFSIDGKQARLFKTLSLQITTSHITDQISLSDNIFEIHTLNSIYTFEALDAPFVKQEIDEPDSRLLKFAEEVNTQKYQKWECTLSGGFLNGLMSKVTLPFPMTKSEAQDYILKNKIRDDVEGHSIGVLLLPIESLKIFNKVNK